MNTLARQASLSMGLSRQEYWGGLPFPPPADLPDPGVKLVFLASPALAGRFFTTAPPEMSMYTRPSSKEVNPDPLYQLTTVIEAT